jgi:hypothetical protein
MATVDSDKVVCRGIHAMIVAVLVFSSFREFLYKTAKDKSEGRHKV